jgi:HAMP domain-containing protein
MNWIEFAIGFVIGAACGTVLWAWVIRTVAANREIDELWESD